VAAALLVALRRIDLRPLPVALGALGAVTLGGSLAAFASRHTLAQLELRPFVSLLLLLPAALILWGRAPRLRGALLPLVAIVPLVVALLLGRSERFRKGANAGTGLASPIASAIRSVVDLDRDGYSPILGGGDCNDLDPDIHPGAFDFPDDGIDQNCMGGDVHLGRKPEDAAFADVPQTVPADANIVMITIDTLRADHLGSYGYARPTSPALDALAASGTLFENAWAHAPSTRYSIPAILTGRYPSQVLWDTSVWWPALQLANHTIAEILKERGFATGAILNYQYFDPVRRMNQGFDEYDNSDARLHVGSDPAETRGSSSKEQADKAIDFLGRHASQRFFLWVHFYDPHFEYEPHPPPASFGSEPMDLYDGEIRYTDDQIARVLARMQELGLDQKTIVVVTGDHGEGFGEHGIKFHGYHLYAAQTKVPLIIKVPGLEPRKVTTPVGHIDILPTLANLAGAPPEASMVGRSLVPELDGAVPGTADRDVFQEVSYEGPTERRAAVSQKCHVIYNMVPDNTFESYDVKTDHAEKHDISGEDECEPDRQKLLGWIDSAQFPPDAAEKLAAALDKTPPTMPLGVSLGGKLMLDGVDLASDSVRAGDDLDLAWHITVKKKIDEGWRPFVHVEGVGGGRFLGDHDPVDGMLPLSRLRAGQSIVDHQKLRVPPGTRPGDYVIWYGVFKGGSRLSVAGTKDNRVQVATIHVIP
jgi:arylsulfatase A-like enzyme